MATPALIGEAIARLPACHGLNEQRALHVIEADRKSVLYRSIWDNDGALAREAAQSSQQRHWLGHRRLHIPLRGEGVVINRKKIQRG